MAPPTDATPPAGVKVTPIPPPMIPYSFPSASPTPTTAQPIAASSPPGATPAIATMSSAPPNPPSTLPQKRALADEDHTPAVRSPLNPAAASYAANAADADVPNVSVREKRAKKDSLKKRESKAAAAAENGRATPEARRKEGTPAGATETGSLAGSTNDGSVGTKAGASNVDEGLPVRVRLAGPLRPTDFDPPASPIFRSRHNVDIGGEEKEFFELLSENPINRRGYVYESGIADPLFPSLHYFRQTEPKPHYAHFSFEDAPPNVYFDQSGLNINGEAGFRTARANVAARQGRWYWECKVTRGILQDHKQKGTEVDKDKKGEPPSHGHVRMGWARREASRDAPVGYDAYGYGIRDRKGQTVHMSRPKEFFAVANAGAHGNTSISSITNTAGADEEGLVSVEEDICEGDVIGLEIQLPSEALHRKVVHGTYNPAVDRDYDEDYRTKTNGHAMPHHEDDTPNIVRDRIPFRFQTTKPVFEKFDYVPTRELEDLANPAPTLTSQGAAAAGAGAGGNGGKRDGPIVGPSGGEPPNPHHPVPCLRTLPGSHIRVYKNGKLMGEAWKDLMAFLPPASTTNSKIQEGARERLDDGTLGYYPAVSVFRGGAVEVNFGPDFWFPPKGITKAHALSEADAATEASTMTQKPDAITPPLTRLRPISDRYAEQIAEDIVYDVVDEAYFWMLDGGAGSEAAPGANNSSIRTARAAAEDGKDSVTDD